MPLVVVVRHSSKYITVQEIEKICKDAWVAMNDIGCRDKLSAEDVGGVGRISPQDVEINTVRIDFYFIDRGFEFGIRLYYELEKRLPNYCKVYLHPNPEWFADPVWAQSGNITQPS